MTAVPKPTGPASPGPAPAPEPTGQGDPCHPVCPIDCGTCPPAPAPAAEPPPDLWCGEIEDHPEHAHLVGKTDVERHCPGVLSTSRPAPAAEPTGPCRAESCATCWPRPCVEPRRLLCKRPASVDGVRRVSFPPQCANGHDVQPTCDGSPEGCPQHRAVPTGQQRAAEDTTALAQQVLDAEKGASPAPWGGAYAGLYSGPLGRAYDEWTDAEENQAHSWERYEHCEACGKVGCVKAQEEYDLDPAVCWVPANYGDTPTGRHQADALLIALLRTAGPDLARAVLALVAEVARLTAERDAAQAHAEDEAAEAQHDAEERLRLRGERAKQESRAIRYRRERAAARAEAAAALRGTQPHPDTTSGEEQ